MFKIFYGMGKYKTLSQPLKIAEGHRQRRFSCHKRAQSFLEYVMLTLVITTALVAMYPYMQRAINARLKQVQVELDESKR